MTVRTPARASIVAALVVAGFMALTAVAANAEVIYSNFPKPLPGNIQSVGFQATSAAELGGQIELAGPARTNPIVVVGMSSWSCQSGGAEDGSCLSTSHSSYSWPITLNIYEVGAGGAVGNRIVTLTQSFPIPYRPSADARCGSNGGWYKAKSCFHGKLFKIKFARLGSAKSPLTLPPRVIVSVAFNTFTHGYAPTGEDGPYDSLNVALAESPGTLVGGDPQPDDAYFNTSFAGFYCDEGTGGTNVFRLDAGCWTAAQPLIEVRSS